MKFKTTLSSAKPMEIITLKEAIKQMKKEHERITKWNEEENRVYMITHYITIGITSQITVMMI